MGLDKYSFDLLSKTLTHCWIWNLFSYEHCLSPIIVITNNVLCVLIRTSSLALFISKDNSNFNSIFTRLTEGYLLSVYGKYFFIADLYKTMNPVVWVFETGTNQNICLSKIFLRRFWAFLSRKYAPSRWIGKALICIKQNPSCCNVICCRHTPNAMHLNTFYTPITSITSTFGLLYRWLSE